jgi:hypothetical protein
MPMKADDHHDDALGVFFDAARDTAPAPSEDMLARILADAETVRRRADDRGPRRTGRARARDALGGWPAMAGLAAATLAGLWIGAALPARVTGPDAPAFVVDMTPEMAFDLAGGSY